MANGYQRGDYLTQFLQQLPQMYRAQQNLDLQRERFEYAKEEGRKDNEYRQEVLSANEERNKLVREQFEQRQIENEQDETYRDATFKQGLLENKQDETYRDATLKNAEKTHAYNAYNQIYGVVKETGDKDVLHLLAKQHPFAKDNPEIIDALNEGYDISESMGQTVRSIEGMSPIDALKIGRPLYTSKYLDDDSKTKLDATLKRKEDSLKFTVQDLRNTPYGAEYAMYYERLTNIDSYLPAGTSAEDRTAFATKQLDSMDAVYKTAKQEQAISGGTWNEPRYDNVEDMGNDELDTLIADFSAPFTERYPFSPDETIDTSTQIQTAGKAVGSKTEIQPKEIKPTLQTLEAEIESLEDRKKILRGSPATLQEFKAVESTLSEKRRELIGLELEESRKKGEKLTEEKYQKLSKASGVPVKVLKERAKNTKNWEKFLNMFKRGW
jgi:hypothetical protein